MIFPHSPHFSSRLIAGVTMLLAAATAGSAAVVEYNLTIARESVAIAGEPVEGMTINGSIPGTTPVRQGQPTDRGWLATLPTHSPNQSKNEHHLFS